MPDKDSASLTLSSLRNYGLTQSGWGNAKISNNTQILIITQI